MENDRKSTPMMEQWKSCKAKAKDALLLFRMGDFYEAFYEDAQILANALDLTLTKRQEIPMSGIPWHTADAYIDRLVNKGFRVAIAEQTEDPRKAQGIVRREVVRVVTPGTILDSSLVSEKSNNFIVSLSRVGESYGIASADHSTGMFQVIEVETDKDLLNELFRLRPAEVVLSKKFLEKTPALFKEFESFISLFDEWHFEHKTAYTYLSKHFGVNHLDGFGLKGMVAAINAAGALLAYLGDELLLSTVHLLGIRPYSVDETLKLDRICQKNLELTETLLEKNRKNTLLHILDHTTTPMGGRLLQQWIKKPLLSVSEITKRQDAIEALYFSPSERASLKEALNGIRDLERLTTKVSSGFATPRDLVALGNSLESIPAIKTILKRISSELVREANQQIEEINEAKTLIKTALIEDPPLRISEGDIFRDDFHGELDALRKIMRGGKDWIARYQTKLKQESGIKTLKVSFNKIFGYYIEVSKGQIHLVPASFERRQTLVNSERFVTQELKEYEEKVLTAEENIKDLETHLFHEIREKIASFSVSLFTTARSLALIDVLLSLAHVAKRHNYCRPLVDQSGKLEIIGGRHPVIETTLENGTFIPNDLSLEKQAMIITGPNMAGKSTFIRQVALIVILAQMGSFVPAHRAHIGVVDQIFTRIGASDDLARGQSTFMVEMSETANILNNATPHSLVILDEIGRGTSTYDGVSIAAAVAEHLIRREIKTLFATHFWELTELEAHFSGAVNHHAEVEETKEGIVFRHKIIPGAADKSYGIHVGRLAGLPLSVLKRAEAILKKLEARKETQKEVKKEKEEHQLTLFQ